MIRNHSICYTGLKPQWVVLATLIHKEQHKWSVWDLSNTEEIQPTNKTICPAVDGRNPAPADRWVSTFQGGAGFLPSTVVRTCRQP